MSDPRPLPTQRATARPPIEIEAEATVIEERSPVPPRREEFDVLKLAPTRRAPKSDGEQARRLAKLAARAEAIAAGLERP